MKFLLAACLVCAALPLYAQTEFADLSVTTEFPGGSADVKSIDRKSGVIHITPKTRSERGWPCWWYMKVEGAKKEQFITLKLTASEGEYKSGRVLNAAWSQPDRAAVSVDNVSWTQSANCRKEDGAATYRIEAPAEVFWLAWGPPFLPMHADEVLQSLKSRLPGANLFELARTRGGRSVQGIRIGDATEKDAARYGVWIQARQHAWEAGSSWVGRGFAEWLASDDPAAAKLRRNATVYYVPIMDVDNVAMGAGGKDAVPRDHNRDWDDKPHYPEVAAAQKRILKLNAHGRFDVFIDLHNPGGSERRPYFFGPINLDELPAIQQQNHARWQAFCASAISGPLPLEPRYKFATYVRTDEERNRMSANWVRNHTAGHVLSTTLETVWNTPHSTQQGYMKVGAQLGMALSRYLEANPRERLSAAEPPAAGESKEPTAGLVAHWRFDAGDASTATDSSGNGNAGVIHHATRVEGRHGLGKALQFDGQRAWVDCGHDETLNLTKQCTIEAWIKPEAPRLHNMTIVGKGYRYRCLFNLQMGIPWDRSKLVFGVGAYQTHEKPIPLGKWSHVAGVCDGQRVATFVNGTLHSVRPFGGAFRPNETSLTIGKAIGAPNGGEFFKGVIDDVRIYDHVLPKYQLTGPTGADIRRANRNITTKGDWGGYEGFPSVCLTANRQLLVSFYAGRGHMDWPDPELPRRGRICVIQSSDLGSTWSEPRTIIDTDTGERDPSLAVLSDGTVVCSYFQTMWYERGRVCEVRTIRSFDNGRTWEKKPAIVPSPWYTEEQKADVIRQAGSPAKAASHEHPVKEEFAAINATTVPVTELSDGDLLLPIYGHCTGTKYHCGMARSTDGGATWSETHLIPNSDHLTEPDIVEFPDGRLLCVMRAEMSHSFSTDRGRTWTVPQTGLLPRGHAPDLLLTRDGVLLCGIREQPHSRTGVLISTDLGKSWSPPRLLNFAGGAYPSFTELPDGRIFSVHYQEALGGNVIQSVFTIDRNKRDIRLEPIR